MQKIRKLKNDLMRSREQLTALQKKHNVQVYIMNERRIKAEKENARLRLQINELKGKKK